MGFRHLFTSPDTISLVDRKQRQSPLRDIDSRAEGFVVMRRKHVAADYTKIGIFNSIEKKYSS